MKSLKIFVSVLFVTVAISGSSRADSTLVYTDGSPSLGWLLPQLQGGASEMAMLFTNPTAVECTLKFIHVGLLNVPGFVNDTTGDLQFSIYSTNVDGFPDSIIFQTTVPNNIFAGGYSKPLNIVNIDVLSAALTFPPGGQWLVSVTTESKSVTAGNVLIFASDQGDIPSLRWYELPVGGFWQKAVCCHNGIDVNMHIYSTISTPLVNEPPVLDSIGKKQVNENDTLQFLVTASDFDNDPIFMDIVDTDLPDYDFFQVSNKSSFQTYQFRWVPTPFDSGTYTATFVAYDDISADSETITIKVNNVNRPPVFDTLYDYLRPEGDTVFFPVIAFDPDGDSLVLSIFKTDLPASAQLLDLRNGSAVFTWPTTFGDAGFYYAVFLADDFNGGVDYDTVNIQITGVNQPPVLNPIGNWPVNENQLLTFGITATDPDGTIPTFTTSTLPAGATFVNNGSGTGTFNWTPTFAQSGLYNITFRATDGSLTDSEVVQITVNDINRPPVLNAIGNRPVNENQLLTFGITATDPDGTIPTFTTSTLPAGATFVNNGSGAGTFNWTPSFAQSGVYNITFRATDGSLIDSEIVQIAVNNVNRPPVLNAIGNRPVNANQLLTFGITATDPDGTIPTFTTSTLPAGATFVNNGSGTGTFNWTPTFAQTGVHNITFRATDGALVDTEIVQITVNNVNRPPVLDFIGGRPVNENQNLNFAVSATDPDGTTPTLTTSILPTGATFVDNFDGTGTFDWTPDFIQADDYNITFRATDGSLVDSEVVQIRVFNTNRPPVYEIIGGQVVDEGQTLKFVISATDADGDPLSYFLEGSNIPSPSDSIFIDSGNGRAYFEWTPTYSEASQYHLLIYLYDNQSYVDIDISITVNNVNRPPVLDPIGAQTFYVNEFKEFKVTGSDPDIDDILLFTISTLPPGAEYFTSPGGRTFSWQPGPAQVGIYTITFYFSDGQATDSEVVAITVVEAPCSDLTIASLTLDGPQQISSSREFQSRLNMTIENLGPLAVDSQVTLSFYYSQSPDLGGQGYDEFLGSAAINSLGVGQFDIEIISSLIMDPDAAYGPAYLIVVIDESGFTDCAVQNNMINLPFEYVSNINPVLEPIGNKEIEEGEKLSFSIASFDPDNVDAIYLYMDFYDPTDNFQPTFVDNYDGTGHFEWTPDFGDQGDYSVTFIASNTDKRAVPGDSETITITVNNVNRPPILEPIADQVIDENKTLTFAVNANDPEQDCLFLYMTSPDLPDEKLFFYNTDCLYYGYFQWTPGFGDAGIYTAIFVTQDYPGGIDADTVIITVNNINAPPVITDIPLQSGDENVLLTFEITATDIDGTIPALSTDLLPPGAAFGDNGNGSGTFSWTPNCSQSGEYAFSCIAVDDSGAVDTFIVGLEILEACDVPLTVVTTPCVQCAPPQFYTDILVSDMGFDIKFSNDLAEQSLNGNISIISARGSALSYFYFNSSRSIEISGHFEPVDTIIVTLNTGIYDIDNSSLDSVYNLTYLTGPVVYPGDCNNDGTVNEIDVLSIGLFWNKQGPDREVGGDYYLLDFFAQPAHFEEQGNGKWEPFNGVYADVDGSGIVDANDLCGIATNFEQTVASKLGGDLNQVAALGQVGSKVLEQMRDALIECPSSAPKTKILDAINNALSASTAILPTEIELHQNYPNPFNPTTTIEFYLPQAEHAVLEIYNMLGQRVNTLVDERVAAGYKTVDWNGDDYSGKAVASGIYFYKLNTETKEIIKRMLLIK